MEGSRTVTSFFGKMAPFKGGGGSCHFAKSLQSPDPLLNQLSNLYFFQ